MAADESCLICKAEFLRKTIRIQPWKKVFAMILQVSGKTCKDYLPHHFGRNAGMNVNDDFSACGVTDGNGRICCPARCDFLGYSQTSDRVDAYCAPAYRKKT